MSGKNKATLAIAKTICRYIRFKNASFETKHVVATISTMMKIAYPAKFSP